MSGHVATREIRPGTIPRPTKMAAVNDSAGMRRAPRAGWMGWLAQLLCVVSLSGWLHIIWNGEPRFMLVDDQGVGVRLLIDDALLRTHGGPGALNQKRVTVTGERVGGQPETIRVLSIEPRAEIR